MNELLNKLSSYNVFNYLLPGAIFCFVSDHIFSTRLTQPDIVTRLFLYYFVGLVISRLGSLIIEPLLKWSAFVKFKPYGQFVAACRKDSKLEVLSEVNNTFRTLAALFVLLLAFKTYRYLEGWLTWLKNRDAAILAVLLALLFLFSYRKQTAYITKRIEADQ